MGFIPVLALPHWETKFDMREFCTILFFLDPNSERPFASLPPLPPHALCPAFMGAIERSEMS